MKRLQFQFFPQYPFKSGYFSKVNEYVFWIISCSNEMSMKSSLNVEWQIKFYHWIIKSPRRIVRPWNISGKHGIRIVEDFLKSHFRFNQADLGTSLVNIVVSVIAMITVYSDKLSHSPQISCSYCNHFPWAFWDYGHRQGQNGRFVMNGEQFKCWRSRLPKLKWIR